MERVGRIEDVDDCDVVAVGIGEIDVGVAKLDAFEHVPGAMIRRGRIVLRRWRSDCSARLRRSFGECS